MGRHGETGDRPQPHILTPPYPKGAIAKINVDCPLNDASESKCEQMGILLSVEAAQYIS